MTCAICKVGETKPGCTPILERAPTTLVVRGVPARICSNCGEEVRGRGGERAAAVPPRGGGRGRGRSEVRPTEFQLYRVFSFGPAPRLYILPGALSGSCHLDPTQYRAFVQAARQQDSG
jgi:YgiT-type zinc finger domain-containing protein